jgi:hypothetical protein
MGLAFEVASSMADGVNGLCAILAWNDTGALDAPPIDGVTLQRTVAALAEAMREVLHGGRLAGGSPPIAEDDLARVLRLEEVLTTWPSAGALPPEVVALAEGCVSGLCGAVSWRELVGVGGA